MVAPSLFNLPGHSRGGGEASKVAPRIHVYMSSHDLP